MHETDVNGGELHENTRQRRCSGGLGISRPGVVNLCLRMEHASHLERERVCIEGTNHLHLESAPRGAQRRSSLILAN